MDQITKKTNIRDTTNLATRVFLSILIITALAGTSVLAQEGGRMFYAMENGDVRSFNMLNGDPDVTIPASAFFGTPPSTATGRNIAYDPTTDLLWYSASDGNVHSVVVSTQAAGPTISDIGYVPLGAMRTIAIDRSARRLYISASSGNVEVYELITNTKMYTIPFSVFGPSEPNPGDRRRLCADGYSYLWYAAADGAFKEFNPIEHNPRLTGREISLVHQVGPPPVDGQHRAFVAVLWGNNDHHLYYASSNGTVQTADLNTLTNADITIPFAWFLNLTNPGELRSLAIDPTWTPSGSYPGMPTGITASDGLYPDYVLVSWNPVPNADDYVVARRVFGTSTWNMTGFPTVGPPFYDSYFVVPGVIYEYSVSARNQWGWGFYSIDTDTGYAGGLAPPSGVAASQGTFLDRVRLTWSAVPGAAGYLVARSPDGGGIPTTEWVTGTMWDDMGALPAGSFWEYWVYACTDPSTCSSDSGSVWGWIGEFIFIDGFESGDPLDWSSVQY